MATKSMIMMGAAGALLLAGTAAGSAYLATSSYCWTDRCREQQIADAALQSEVGRQNIRTAWDDVASLLDQRVEIAKSFRNSGSGALAGREQASQRELGQIATVTAGLTDGELLSVGEPYLDRADAIRATGASQKAAYANALAGLDHALARVQSGGGPRPPLTATAAAQTVETAALLGGAVAQAHKRLARAGFTSGRATADGLGAIRENTDALCAAMEAYTEAVTATALQASKLRAYGRTARSATFAPLPENACDQMRAMPEPSSATKAPSPRAASRKASAPEATQPLSVDLVQQRARLQAQAEIQAMQVQTKALNDYRDRMLQTVESLQKTPPPQRTEPVKQSLPEYEPKD